MLLSLSPRDLSLLVAAQRALLRSPEHPTAADWNRAVLLAACDLFRTGRALALLRLPAARSVEWGPALEPFAPRLERLLAGDAPPAAMPGDRPEAEAWSWRAVERRHGAALGRASWHREVLVPAGGLDGGGMRVALPGGEAVLCVAPDDPGQEGFGRRAARLLRLLLPAYGAGALALAVRAATVDALLPPDRSLRESYHLTRREAEVALLLARGLSNRAVAAHLEVSAHTVRTHAQHIFQKLGVRTRTVLALRILTQPEPDSRTRPLAP